MTTGAAEAEAARCPEHPERESVGTCSRCGRFVCIECRGASAAFPRCPACTALEPDLALNDPPLRYSFAVKEAARLVMDSIGFVMAGGVGFLVA